MVRPLLLGAVLLSGIASAIAGEDDSAWWAEVCQEIASSVSAASEVFYDSLLSFNYAEDISHWASSSSQLAVCSFEPGTAEDVGKALEIIGKSRTPFAVKGGGHTGNPGFSSTPGVQIAMTRFSEISYDSTTQTVIVGSGLIWDDIYEALEPHKMNVVGGRVTGVGVAGFTLGGGYSWLSNQYGLTIDTVQAFELVLPNGTVADVTETTNPDLFFALKGGLNNFGIVTRFTLKTFPQTQVWGGLITYTANVLDQVNQATANFAANNHDPKASVITIYNSLIGLVGPNVFEIIFYDGPSPPDGIFDEFMEIPALTRDISARSFSSFVQSSPANSTYGTRGIFNSISLEGFPVSLLESIVNETIYWSKELGLLETEFLLSYNVEPFLPTFLGHNTTPSAYPPSRAEGFLPLGIYFSWLLPTSDQAFQDAARISARTLKEKAIECGQSEVADAAIYPNYAIFDTPLVNMYGANLLRLQAIKAEVDPDNVMGLTGGFKL